MDAIDNKTYYRLGQGTPHERFVPPFKPGVELGAEYDATFGVLMQLFQTVFQTTGGKIHSHQVLAPGAPGSAVKQLSGLGTIISAIWILWSYASHDIAALRTELAATKAGLDEATAQLKVLRADFDALRHELRLPAS